MEERTDGYAMVYVPTLGDKLRRFFGYRMNHADEPPNLDPAKHVGWMKTHVGFRFNWRDRLRLLLTGRLGIDVTQYTTQQVDESVNSISYRIYAPLEKTPIE